MSCRKCGKVFRDGLCLRSDCPSKDRLTDDDDDDTLTDDLTNLGVDVGLGILGGLLGGGGSDDSGGWSGGGGESGGGGASGEW
jgi:uncharacterized membrane protein YgcG